MGYHTTWPNEIPEPWHHHYSYNKFDMPVGDKHFCPIRRLTDIAEVQPWAFEVSTVVDDVKIVFYSKLMSLQWPHYGALCKRMESFQEDL